MANGFGDDELTINIHIEQLVLDSIDIEADQQDALKAAVAAEITRQFSNHGHSLALTKGFNTRLIKANSIAINNASDTTTLGKQIGKAVFRGIQI